MPIVSTISAHDFGLRGHEDPLAKVARPRSARFPVLAETGDFATLYPGRLSLSIVRERSSVCFFRSCSFRSTLADKEGLP